MIRAGARLALSMILLASSAFGSGIQGECDIRFRGTSTLHDFSGKVRCRPFEADLVKDADGRTTVPLVEIVVPVDGMDTGNKDRDRQMREMFESERFPWIQGTVRDEDVKRIREAMAGDDKAVLDLSLRIRDVEKRIPATVTRLREEGDQVRFDVEFPVSLSDFGLKAPSFLFFIRVGDEVVVKGNVRLEVSSKE